MTKIKNGTTPEKVTSKRKAAGGVHSTTATNSVSQADSIGSSPTQLHLDLGDSHVAIAPSASRPVRRISSIARRPNRLAGTKLETILVQFVMGRNMNRFEAEHHHDHCLHSTVSTLQNSYGIQIARKFEYVPCLHGRGSVRCKRYWLDSKPDNLTAARALLSILGERT